MGQSPIPVYNFGKNPSGAAVPLLVDANGNLLVNIGGENVKLLTTAAGLVYQGVAASQTAALLGATGAIGDVINTLIIIPATSAAGVVSIIDGSGGGAVTTSLFAGGGTTALTDLAPITVNLNAKSAVGGWHVTTGANVSVLAIGQFT